MGKPPKTAANFNVNTSAKPPKEWSLERTSARIAETMLRAKYSADPWGEINVAHLDTGIRPFSIFGNWVNVAAGVNYMEAGQPPIDPLTSSRFGGHGTRTLSVLTGDNHDFKGVAPGLPAVPYRVCDDVLLGTKRELNNVAQAIRHAIEVNTCEVITISLGYPWVTNAWHPALGEAIDLAYERGVIVIAAGGQPIDRPCYPGKFFRAICVGGYTMTDKLSIYQQYGDKGRLRAFVDVWAPAKPVWRVGIGRDGAGQPIPLPDNGDGTSFATPHVAAAAAMWLSYHRDSLVGAYDAPWQRVEAFRALIHTSSESLESFAGFEGMKVGGVATRKGNTTAKPLRCRGGLKMDALLGAPLPAKGTLKFEDRLAKNQSI